MAERALPPGASGRRAFFGAFDADGWTWAGIKAFGWFLLLVLLLGYLPDRAYYFTVFPTINIGFNIASPINLCPASNGDLPCPAPAGAVVPWQGSPAELALPEGRSEAALVPVATNLYLVGGRGPSGATSSVLQTSVSADGNLSPWRQAKALPAAVSNAAVATIASNTFVIGGSDQSGRASASVYEAVVNSGQLTEWKSRTDLKLPKPLAGAAAVAGPSSVWLVGGQNADGTYSRAVYRSMLNATTNDLGAWQEQAALVLPAGRALAVGAQVGNFLYVIGGQDEHGAQATVFRLQLDSKGEPAIDPATNGVRGWSVSEPGQSLPAPRTDATGWVSNNSLYVVGGHDASGAPAPTFFWTIPDSAGTFTGGWQHMNEDDLAGSPDQDQPRAGAASIVTSGHAFVIGGQGPRGLSTATFRADIAPQPPFFALGLVGATIPAMSIKGDIGQQLGYIAAGTVGGVDFILLVLVGIAHSHPRQTRRLLSRLTGGRVRAPAEE